MNFRRRKLDSSRARRSSVLALALVALGASLACGGASDAAPTALTPLPVVDDPASMELDDPADALSIDADAVPLTSINAATYEGSGEFVHPDAYVFPAPWHGRRHWFVATPYPGGVSRYENPSVFLATKTISWNAPAGVVNPLAHPDSGAYLSDPDLEYDPARDELRLYYRQTTRDHDQLYVSTSRDGHHWDTPRQLLSERLYSLISPAVVREQDGSWRMWTVDPGANGCRARASAVSLRQRRSADGLRWIGSAGVSLDIPGFVPWHADVQYVAAKHEYWALVAAYPDGLNCSNTSVFFGRSTDGRTWRMSPSPLLAPGEIATLADVVYRSTFHYDAPSDVLSVWFSGARLVTRTYAYGGALARYPMAQVLDRVDRPFSAADASRRTRLMSAATPDDSIARAAFVNAFP